MGRLPGWIPDTLESLNQGCARSLWLARLAREDLALETGQEICRDLWPFIRILPDEIARVRDKLPPEAVSGRQFLGQLADEERVYQNAFIMQCRLAGLSDADIAGATAGPATEALIDALRAHTCGPSASEGIYAIIAAEFAAAVFARACLPYYERFFKRHSRRFRQQEIEQGLAWLRHHARPHPRQALWIRRMLDGWACDGLIPAPVLAIQDAIFALWHCPRNKAPAGAG